MVKVLTNFLFTGSLNPKSPMSFCGNNFASGRRHDNMLNAFNTSAGGVTSSEILPNRSQSLVIKMVNAPNVISSNRCNNSIKEVLHITFLLINTVSLYSDFLFMHDHNWLL